MSPRPRLSAPSPVALALSIGIVLACVAGSAAEAARLNGFDLSSALIPAGDIHKGGPPRDGIPSIDDPVFVPAAQADQLEPDDRVLGIARNGIAKAYPVAIMNWHEIVNDTLGPEPVVVTYCPLCGSGMAFKAQMDGRHLVFGVSGLLYNSDVLLYDRQSESLWSQIMGQAISGPMRGAQLELIPLAHTTWSDWRARHPDTRVLAPDTRHARDYRHDPYAGYADNRKVWFPVRFRSKGYHPKERVIGVSVDGAHKAYPFVELARTAGVIEDRIGDRRVSVRFDPEHETGAVFDAGGEELPSVILFWFAWYAFHPETEIFTAAR